MWVNVELFAFVTEQTEQFQKWQVTEMKSRKQIRNFMVNMILFRGIDPFRVFFFSTFDMDKLGKIRRHQRAPLSSD